MRNIFKTTQLITMAVLFIGTAHASENIPLASSNLECFNRKAEISLSITHNQDGTRTLMDAINYHSYSSSAPQIYEKDGISTTTFNFNKRTDFWGKDSKETVSMVIQAKNSESVGQARIVYRNEQGHDDTFALVCWVR